jgi:CubicO group peptidase (beta-lactamase class C family)
MRMIKSRPLGLLTALFLSLTITISSCDKGELQEPIPPSYAGVDQIMSSRFGGRDRAVLALIENGQVVYRQSYGKIPYNQHVNIESTSMWVASVVILNLVDKGVLSLEDPVSRFYPEFASHSQGRITIRQLLSQTSGISPNHSCLNNLFGTTQDCALGILYDGPRFAAGTEFEFGLGGFQVVAGIAVRAAGKNWQDLYRDTIKFPMKMVHLDFEYGEYYYLPNARVADGLYSNAEDFANFMILLMNNGWYGSTRIISEASIHEMFTNQLGTTPVALSPSRGYLNATEVIQQYKFGLGVWLTDINPTTGDARTVIAPGTFGFIPWMNPETKNGGVLIVPGNFTDAWSAYQAIRAQLSSMGK